MTPISPLARALVWAVLTVACCEAAPEFELVDQVEESDAASVHPIGLVRIPADAQAQSWDWMTLGHEVFAGRDYVRRTRTAGLAAGQASEYPLTMELLGDTRPDEDGDVHFIYKPTASTWAEALPPLVRISGLGAVRKILSWRDRLVWVTRSTGPTHHLEAYQRTDAGMRQLASIPPPADDPLLFEQVTDSGSRPTHNYFISGRMALIHGIHGPQVYILDDSRTQGWSFWPTPRDAQALHGGELYGNIVRRFDSTSPRGWSPSGFHHTAEAGRGDTLYSLFGAGHRLPGTDNIWKWTQLELPHSADAMSYAVEEDLIAVLGAQSTNTVRIAARSPEGWNVSSIALQTSSFADWRTNQLVLQDRFLAVGRPRVSAVAGAVQFFLRDAVDDSVWQTAGKLERNEPLFGKSVFIDGRDVIIEGGSPTFPIFYWSTFPGDSVRVLDDDRTRLTVHDRTLREPADANELLEVEVTLPREARAPVTAQYVIEPDSAQIDEDFSATTGSMTIPAGERRGTIPVTLLADQLAERDETFRVRILSVTGGLPPRLPIAVITLRDSDDWPLLRGERRPVPEGLGPSPVTVRLEPAVDTRPTSIDLDVRVGGFPEGTAAPGGFPVATADMDIIGLETLLQLSPTNPAATISLTAPQDNLQESSLEAISFTVTPRGPPVLSPEFSPSDLHQIEPFPLTVTSVEAGGDWFFVLSTIDRQAWTIDCFQRNATGRGWIKRQQIPVVLSTGEARIATDGQTLALAVREFASVMSQVNLFRPTGPPDSPWQSAIDFKFIVGTELPSPELVGDCLRLGGAVLERVSGDRDWRFTSDFVARPLDMAGPHRLRFDGDAIAHPDADGEHIHIFRRARSGPLKWVFQDTFRLPVALREPGLPPGVLANGRMFYLAPPEAYIFALGDTGWVEELRFQIGSSPFTHVWPMTEFTGQLLCTPADTFFRRGRGRAAWTRQNPPASAGLNSVYPVALGDGFQIRQSQSATQNYIQVWEPGLHVQVADDDSLEFRFEESLPAVEKAGEESRARYSLVSDGPVPIPISARVRTRDGTAMAGADYLSVERDLWLFPPGEWVQGSNEFDVPILPDRMMELSEAFALEAVSLSFGRPPSPATFSIADPPPPTGAGQTVVREPPNDSITDFVVLPLASGTDIPASMTLERLAGSSATIGTDFSLPDTITVAPGATALAIPITVHADAEVEGPEKVRLRTIPGFYSISITILDETAPALSPASYTVPQNQTLVADGANGNPPSLADTSNLSGAYVLNGVPERASITLAGSGEFTLVPPLNFLGDFLFAYTVNTERELIGANAAWRYWHPLNGVDPTTVYAPFPAEWKTGGAVSLPWATGAGAISYGGFGGLAGPDLGSPPSGKRFTAYFHMPFEMPQGAEYPLQLRLAYDDAVIIYVNGVERARDAMRPDSLFATAPDSYSLLSGGGGAFLDADEARIRTIDLGIVPLAAGTNHLAISLHNATLTSSDLGLKLESLTVRGLTASTSVRVAVTEANQIPLVIPDTYQIAQNRLFQSGDAGTQGLFANDGLLRPDGVPFDPILEIIATQPTVGSLELIGLTGQFRFTPPIDFVGSASFTYQVRDKDGLSAPAPVELSVAPGRSFDVWRQAAFPAADNFSVPAAMDGDGDGLDLVHEYALLGSPVAAGAPAQVHGSPPVFQTRVRLASDLTITVERADTLADNPWNQVLELRGTEFRHVTPGEAVNFDTSRPGEMGITILAPPLAPHQFYRLRCRQLDY
ncbi:MAG: Calx-beta domain-containing protein [Verrucomicrobiales bacterium]